MLSITQKINDISVEIYLELTSIPLYPPFIKGRLGVILPQLTSFLILRSSRRMTIDIHYKAYFQSRARRVKIKQERLQQRNVIATIEKNGARCQEKVATI